ncbi:MAG: hypothetical protein LBQ09_10130, partial [Acidobacteriaceae bacterium]|nr:hypothetical protein [Acidobacteriaceae bacterium]
DGRAHPIRVEVSRKGLTVRARRSLLLPQGANDVRTPRQAVAAALSTPLPMSALPLRIATFSLQGPEVGRVQLLIHADIGTDYPTSRPVTLAYTIADAGGRIVESQGAVARLPPIMIGVPSALQFVAGASLPPGDYLLKLAVAESDRIGTVEHQFHAGLVPAGAVTFSDLMVGGPDGSLSDLLQPTIGHTIVFGAVHAYVEAYGPAAGALTAKYEIAATADGEALFTKDVQARTAGSARAIFTEVLPVRQLPPGDYVMRVTVANEAGPVKVLRRSFAVAAPAVLMTSAVTSGGTVLPLSEVYLPVADVLLTRAFEKSDVLDPQVLDRFRARVPEAERAAFDAGVRSLSSGSYGDAERSFRQAVSSEEDSSAALVYIAATLAAVGRDLDAAGAWQSSMITGVETPEVYDWLAAALMRVKNHAQARSTLEEATAKWPADPRFAKPLALLYATLGQGLQAFRLLERHIDAHKDDSEAMLLGVEWIYQLAVMGVTAHSGAEDVKLAHEYADGYLKTNGPRAALVRQWLDYLDKRR